MEICFHNSVNLCIHWWESSKQYDCFPSPRDFSACPVRCNVCVGQAFRIDIVPVVSQQTKRRKKKRQSLKEKRILKKGKGAKGRRRGRRSRRRNSAACGLRSESRRLRRRDGQDASDRRRKRRRWRRHGETKPWNPLSTYRSFIPQRAYTTVEPYTLVPR